MRNNAWVALAIALGIIALSVMLHVIFITIQTPDGEVIEGNLLRFAEGDNITITGSDATNTITISATGSGAASLNVQENGTTAVTGTGVLNFLDPFDVVDDGGDAQISIDWPNCELKYQATTFSTGTNAIGCQFIPPSYAIPNFDSSNPITLPGYACATQSTSLIGQQNNILFGLIVPPETTTYTALSINVTSAGSAGSIARVGLYEANQGASGFTPGNLIDDAGAVGIDSTGVKSIGISEELTGGRPYFTAFVHDSAANPSLTMCNAGGYFISPVTARAVATSGSINIATPVVSGAGTGALPNPSTNPDELTTSERSTIVKLSE